LARLLPGVGNPMNLPIDEFNAYLQKLPGILEAEHGKSSEAHDNRAFVEAEMRKLHG